MSARKFLAQLRATGNGGDSSNQAVAPVQQIQESKLTPDVEEFVKKALGDSSDSEDEPPPPESVVWELDSKTGAAPDVLDEKYIWDRSKRRGQRSRKNYSSFLASRIRANEDALREERETQGGDGGPDFS